MPPSCLCIVARPMSRARITTSLVAWLALVGALAAVCGCEGLDGRKRNRAGNKLFKEGQFAAAAGEYEKALTTVNDPLIHFNLGLAYAKTFKTGVDGPIILDVAGSAACTSVPGVKETSARVCIKEGDTHFAACDDKDPCASSFTCQQTTLCTTDDKQLAELAAKHFAVWLDAQPSDDEIKATIKQLSAELREQQIKDCGQNTSDKEGTAAAATLTSNCATPAVMAIKTRIDEMSAKDKIRKQLTQLYLDSSQYDKAVTYWETLLKQHPDDTEIMGNLAGINLKANDWRKSIEWYTKVATIAKNDPDRVAAYQSIGNVTWSKLNSKSLTAADSIELSDRGIAALQKAAAISPKVPRLFGLQGSIYSFRSMLQGASFAAAIDRATAQDLLRQSRVLSDEAKKAAGQDVSPPPPTTPPAAPGGATAKSGG